MWPIQASPCIDLYLPQHISQAIAEGNTTHACDSAEKRASVPSYRNYCYGCFNYKHVYTTISFNTALADIRIEAAFEGYRLTIALWRHTLDQHHTGLSRKVEVHRLTILLWTHIGPTPHWVEVVLTIALWGHTLDEHHTGLRQVDNSPVETHTG